MLKQWIVAVAAVALLCGCLADNNRIADEFRDVDEKAWNWHDPRSFTFEIREGGYMYDLFCGLRITGSYKYSNIWLIYTLDGPDHSVKKQFQIQLSDNTGKWLGKGMNNLISYEQRFEKGLKLKPGKYTVRFSQNMRDEALQAVSDIGLKVVKTGKVY